MKFGRDFRKRYAGGEECSAASSSPAKSVAAIGLKSSTAHSRQNTVMQIRETAHD